MTKRIKNAEVEEVSEVQQEFAEETPKKVAPRAAKKSPKKAKFAPEKEVATKRVTTAQLSRQADKLEVQAAKLRAKAQSREAKELMAILRGEVKASEGRIKELERELVSEKKTHDRASIKLGKLLDKLAVEGGEV